MNSRVKWVDSNTEALCNYETNDIINRADEDSRACFVGFCIEFKRFDAFMNDHDATNFKTHLPIQLDATCNGYQHISLLTRQKEVFKPLNLKSSTHNDNPEDFYGYLLIEISPLILTCLVPFIFIFLLYLELDQIMYHLIRNI